MWIIKNWDATFENSTTRKLKSLRWFQCPTEDSNGFVELMTHGELGLQAFGVFIAICQWTSLRPRELRGKICRRDGAPLGDSQLANYLRIPISHLSPSLELLKSTEIGWLIEWEETGAPLGDPSCLKKSPSCLPKNSGVIYGGEGKGEEGKGREKEKIQKEKNETGAPLGEISQPTGGPLGDRKPLWAEVWAAVEKSKNPERFCDPDFQEALSDWHETRSSGGKVIGLSSYACKNYLYNLSGQKLDRESELRVIRNAAANGWKGLLIDGDKSQKDALNFKDILGTDDKPEDDDE